MLAYALVEPDRFAEKIYVADTGAQLAALVQAGTGATALPCADLLSALAAGAGADPEQGPSLDPEAQGKNLSAWDAGGLAAATAACVAGANETDVQLTRVAVSLLQAFVDTHGCAPRPPGSSPLSAEVTAGAPTRHRLRQWHMFCMRLLQQGSVWSANVRALFHVLSCSHALASSCATGTAERSISDVRCDN